MEKKKAYEQYPFNEPKWLRTGISGQERPELEPLDKQDPYPFGIPEWVRTGKGPA